LLVSLAQFYNNRGSILVYTNNHSIASTSC